MQWKRKGRKGRDGEGRSVVDGKERESLQRINELKGRDLKAWERHGWGTKQQWKGIKSVEGKGREDMGQETLEEEEKGK